jgi:HD-like signal output (HDOD) protein
LNYLLLVFVLLAAAVVFLVTRGKGKKPAARPSQPKPAAPAAAKVASPAQPAPAPQADSLRSIVRGANPQIEAMLHDVKLARASDLSAQEAQDIRLLLGRIPRPPAAMHKLVSPEYLAQASTADLGNMVVAEPRVAAKVLVVVNSPMYGLKSPLGSVGQAITFLGMNTVRSICLQYLMDESFRTNDPEIKHIFSSLWNASALASELCFKLAQRLQLPEPGTLVTQVVLSFLGHAASHSLLPKQVVLPMMTKGLLERSRQEQESLGLCAAELGALLMQQWELPDSIVQRVRAIDLVLQTPCPAKPTEQDIAAAFCYLCARLGEKMARGEVKDLATFQPELDPSPEFFHLHTYLQQPAFAKLHEAFALPDIAGPIGGMLLSMQRRD